MPSGYRIVSKIRQIIGYRGGINLPLCCRGDKVALLFLHGEQFPLMGGDYERGGFSQRVQGLGVILKPCHADVVWFEGCILGVWSIPCLFYDEFLSQRSQQQRRMRRNYY